MLYKKRQTTCHIFMNNVKTIQQFIFTLLHSSADHRDDLPSAYNYHYQWKQPDNLLKLAIDSSYIGPFLSSRPIFEPSVVVPCNSMHVFRQIPDKLRHPIRCCWWWAALSKLRRKVSTKPTSAVPDNATIGNSGRRIKLFFLHSVSELNRKTKHLRPALIILKLPLHQWVK